MSTLTLITEERARARDKNRKGIIYFVGIKKNMTIFSRRGEEISSDQGYNERQWKRKKKRKQQQRLKQPRTSQEQVSTYGISSIKRIKRASKNIVVQNNSKEMYKKVCCSGKVISLFFCLLGLLLFLLFSLPSPFGMNGFCLSKL